jgi:acyl-homoserine-lactone acylase
MENYYPVPSRNRAVGAQKDEHPLLKLITTYAMKKLFLPLVIACASCGSSPQPSADKSLGSDIQAWQAQAQNVTIVRDDWGIPHVRGKTDADAVFGLIYAQAEDDFNRVETNFLLSQGRLAEAQGEKELWRDLRMQLFIDPEDMKSKYESSPGWLKQLMNAWADGLNYYLYTHPRVKPRVLTRFEPWMALTFSEGSIGGDIERVSLADLEAFYSDHGQPPAQWRSASSPSIAVSTARLSAAPTANG